MNIYIGNKKYTTYINDKKIKIVTTTDASGINYRVSEDGFYRINENGDRRILE